MECRSKEVGWETFVNLGLITLMMKLWFYLMAKDKSVVNVTEINDCN